MSAGLLTAAEQAPTGSATHSHGSALQRLETPGMRQIRITRVVPPQPPVPCGGRPLSFKNVRVRRWHRDLDQQGPRWLGDKVCGGRSRVRRSFGHMVAFADEQLSGRECRIVACDARSHLSRDQRWIGGWLDEVERWFRWVLGDLSPPRCALRVIAGCEARGRPNALLIHPVATGEGKIGRVSLCERLIDAPLFGRLAWMESRGGVQGLAVGIAAGAGR